jgi:quercetin dioxygenase-like cupin family protein
MSVDSEHPLKVSGSSVLADSSLREDRGWHRMDVRWLITTERMGSRKTVVGQTTFPPGGKHDLHRHPNAEEWELVLQGEGIKRVGDESFLMRAGDVCFCPQNVYHSLENASETELLVTVWGYCGAGSLEEAGYLLPGDDEG